MNTDDIIISYKKSQQTIHIEGIGFGELGFFILLSTCIAVVGFSPRCQSVEDQEIINDK